jgi:CrcB protein
VTPLLVVLGALVGAPLRLLAHRVAVARRGPGSVLGTCAVNVAGSAVLGVLLGLREVSPAVLALVGTGFCGTLTVNVAGSALLGLLLGLGDVPPAVLALLGTGFCGTLTTFSTFGYEVVRLVEGRAVLRAAGYVAATLVLGLGAAAAGYLLVRG